MHQKPKIINLFINPHENPVKKSFEAVECICALAKSQPQLFISEWDSLKHYLEIVFNLEDDWRITGLKILEEWFSNYGTAAIVNQK